MSNKVFYEWADFTTDEIFDSDLFEGADWLDDYLSEKRQNPFPKLRYSPFNVWVHKEHKSKYFNVNKDGFRIVNYNQANADKKLFILGDSIIFGEYYVRDQDSLPSQVAKFLSEVDAKTEVFNFSQTGYTLMNQLNLITKLLSKGDVPDEIFIYFGINEIFVNSLLGQDHIGQRLYNENRKFGYTWKMFLKEAFQRKVMRNKFPSFFYYDANEKIDEICNAELKKLLNCIKIIKCLLNEYKINFNFYILPTIFNTSKNLTIVEKNILNKIKNKHPLLADIFELYYFKLARAINGEYSFVDLNNCFNNESKSIFLDFCHCSSFGLHKLAKECITTCNTYKSSS